MKIYQKLRVISYRKLHSWKSINLQCHVLIYVASSWWHNFSTFDDISAPLVANSVEKPHMRVRMCGKCHVWSIAPLKYFISYIINAMSAYYNLRNTISVWLTVKSGTWLDYLVYHNEKALVQCKDQSFIFHCGSLPTYLQQMLKKKKKKKNYLPQMLYTPRSINYWV